MRDGNGDPLVGGDATYVWERFRPRVEGAFSRIERWTERSNGRVHWRTRDGNNVLRIYGRDDNQRDNPASESTWRNSRVADPDNPDRVFEWLLEEARDELGNIVQYTYKRETMEGVGRSFVERARHLPGHACAYHYPKRITYGNAVPDTEGAWAFEAVFDYGEHNGDPGDPEADPVVDPTPPTPSEDVDWPVRSDPYSSFRAGFDMRCYRLCRRVLMFHHFDGTTYLVRSTDLRFDEQAHLTKLLGVTHWGWRKDGTDTTTKAMPEVRFSYLEAQVGQSLEQVEGLERGDQGFAADRWQWVDLDGEGLSGLLTEVSGAWYYNFFYPYHGG